MPPAGTGVRDELVEAIAQAVASSSVMAFAVAEKIKDDPRVIEKVLEQLDAETLGRALARSIIFYNDSNKSSHAIATYQHIQKEAKRIASEAVAEQLLRDVEHV